MTKSTISGKNNMRRFTWAASMLAVVVAGLYPFRGSVLCTLFYPECSPLLSVPEMPGWNVPTDPQEKAAYDYAHSLPTPPSAPQPVPFDFRAARIASLEGGRSVEQQYFEHLCETEAGEYIVKRAKDVDGFLLMRPRGWMEVTPENLERYAPEEPTGFGGFSDDNQLDAKHDYLGGSYVQPLGGVYSYVEYVQPGDPSTVIRVERAAQGDAEAFPHGVDAGWRTHSSGVIDVPYVVIRTTAASTRARYAYVWRGLRRDRDREFGIAGGEFLIVDRDKNEVMALQRKFNSTYVPGRPDLTRWSAARDCGQATPLLPPTITSFVTKVLNPNLHVNDAFVPRRELPSYHEHLMKMMENHNAR